MRYGAIERDDVLSPGTVVANGAYRLGAVLGRGGMATVYAGCRIADGESVAVKVLSAKLADRSDIATRMRNELELATRLGDHPNFVRPLAGGRLPEAGDVPYLVTELARGPALADLIAMQRQLAVSAAVQIARDIARAVVALHERDIVHRDIKPDNIVVVKTELGQVAKLIDFGLATTIRRTPQDKRLTAVFERPGTRHYMAPEQAAGAPVDSAFDVYALGVTIFEMLVGAPPMGERSEDEVIARKLDARQPSFSIVGLRDGLPTPLCAVVDACLRKLPSERISPRMLVAALDRLAIEVGAGPVVAEVARPTDEHAGSASIRQQGRRRGRMRWPWIGAGAVLAVVATWSVARNDDTERAPSEAPIEALIEPPIETPIEAPIETPIEAPAGVLEPASAPKPTLAAPTIDPPLRTSPQLAGDGHPVAAPAAKPIAKATTDTPDATSAQCAERRERVAALVDDNPTRALELLRARPCWESGVVHKRLRMRALVAADRYDECVRVARSSTDAEVTSYLELCLAKAESKTKAER
jgi:serine/threonine-protein kinase